MLTILELKFFKKGLAPMGRPQKTNNNKKISVLW